MITQNLKNVKLKQWTKIRSTGKYTEIRKEVNHHTEKKKLNKKKGLFKIRQEKWLTIVLICTVLPGLGRGRPNEAAISS